VVSIEGLAFLHDRRRFSGAFKGPWHFKLQEPFKAFKTIRRVSLFDVDCVPKKFVALYQLSLQVQWLVPLFCGWTMPLLFLHKTGMQDDFWNFLT
jgi:hypothetical protein